MAAFRRILCPVDFSEHSRHAIDHAVAVARWYDGRVTALHAMAPIPVSDPMVGNAGVYSAEDFARMHAALEAFVGEEAGSAPIDVKVVDGPAVGAIVRAAEELSADLLVLGTHGLSGFQHFMLGSVTERVLRKSPIPVLTVPPRAPDAEPIALREILCPVDFSPASLKALKYGASLAREAGARLTTLHVVEPVAMTEPVLVGGGAFANYQEEVVEATRARLHDIAPKDVELQEDIMVGKPYQQILERAAADHSDLIVIGVHSGIIERLGFFGSTTNHIVREASCPVLSLRG